MLGRLVSKEMHYLLVSCDIYRNGGGGPDG